jgi:hypothetical protein
LSERLLDFHGDFASFFILLVGRDIALVESEDIGERVD